MARVTPIPKSKPKRNIENDIRPISVTCSVSRVAEHFVSKIFDDHFDDVLDDNQFGTTKGRSTTLALIKFSHELLLAADDHQTIIKVLFIDFRKAFEMIDHSILRRKLANYEFTPQISTWMLSLRNL